MKRQANILTEFGTIYRASDFKSDLGLTQLSVSDKAFEALKALAFSGDADSILTYAIYKGREQLRFKNYVGLIQTPDGTQIEVLPKIAQQTDVFTARTVLLKMIRSLPDAPFRSLTTAHLHETRLPLWEVFLAAFVAEVEKIMRQGLQKSYVTVEANESFLRGKWLVERQITKNATRQERFYTAHDDFMVDILPNQLLKTTVTFLEKRSRDVRNQARLRQLRFALDDVQTLENPMVGFQQIEKLDRRFDRYATALQWARALWLGKGWAAQRGDNHVHSLLFPTERLFESYVTKGFRQHLPEAEVRWQDSRHHLIEEHETKPKFKLRPDLVIRIADKMLVIDVKWKQIVPTKSSENYGIEQADLYQLYAYGHKYAADELFLIYPAHAQFREPLLPFRYDDRIRLRVIPFDVTAPIADEMRKIRKYFAYFA